MANVERDPVRGTLAVFGERKLGGAVGVFKTEGAMNELTLDVTGDNLNDNAIHKLYLPKGAKIRAMFYEVDEAFTLGGTTPRINVGTEGSESTNGGYITEAQAEAVGSGDVSSTLAGTWATSAAGLAAQTEVGILLSGTTPTSARTGRVRITIQYVKLGTQS